MVAEPQPPHRPQVLGIPGHSLRDLRPHLALREGVKQPPAELQVQPVLIIPGSRQYTRRRVLLMDTHGSLNRSLSQYLLLMDVFVPMDRRSYHLDVVQHPIRTAEFGAASLSRLPLAPPIVVQLVIRDHAGRAVSP